MLFTSGTVGLRHALHHGQFQKGGREKPRRASVRWRAASSNMPRLDKSSPRRARALAICGMPQRVDYANLVLRFLELAQHHLKRLGQIEPARGGVVSASAQPSIGEQGFGLAPQLVERGGKMASSALAKNPSLSSTARSRLAAASAGRPANSKVMPRSW